MMKKALLLILTIVAISYFWLSRHTTTPNEAAEQQELSKILVSESSINSDNDVQSNTINNDSSLANSETDETEIATALPPESYIVSCPEIKRTTSQEQVKQEHEYLKQNWLSSSNPHIKINASIFTSDPTNDVHIKALLNYHEQFPKSIIAYDRLLDMCAAKKSDYCTPEFFDKATQVDKNNGLLQLKIASFYFEQKNQELALEYIRSAAQYTTFDPYHFHYVDNIWQYLKDTKKVPRALTDAIGYSAALSWNAMSFSKYCMKQEEARESDACISLGQAMQSGGRTGFIQMLGGSIEKRYAELAGDQERLSILESKYRAIIAAVSKEEALKSFTLATYDESLAEELISNAKNHGEILAADMLIKEAVWRSKDPNYNPCRQ